MNDAQRVPHPCRVLCDRVGILTYPLHNLARPIGRPVIDSDHFIVVVIEHQQSVERLFDALFFIARRNDDGNARIAGRYDWIAVPLRTGNIRHGRHAQRSIHNAGKPGQCENGSRNPIKITHSA